MTGKYKDKEVKIIGQNFYNCLISIFDEKENKLINKIVPKKEIELFMETEEE